MAKTVLHYLAMTIQARLNCLGDDKAPSLSGAFLDIHTETIRYIARNHLPHGSGIDSGCEVDLGRSADDKIVITTAYHHMNDGGYYDGWTEHTVIIKPTFNGFDIKVTGRDRNDIKDYLADTFDHHLRQEFHDTRELRRD